MNGHEALELEEQNEIRRVQAQELRNKRDADFQKMVIITLSVIAHMIAELFMEVTGRIPTSAPELRSCDENSELWFKKYFHEQ